MKPVLEEVPRCTVCEDGECKPEWSRAAPTGEHCSNQPFAPKQLREFAEEYHQEERKDRNHQADQDIQHPAAHSCIVRSGPNQLAECEGSDQEHGKKYALQLMSNSSAVLQEGLKPLRVRRYK